MISAPSENICKYCDKAFRKESSLAVHVCEPKRRAQQEHDPAVKLGFQAYLQFYAMTQGSTKLKTYSDFAASSYYSAFVKFGYHVRSINAIAPSKFVDWVIKQNKKLDHWCHDKVYAEYLTSHLQCEAAQDALIRTVQQAQTWAEENSSSFDHMFRLGNKNKLCYYITQGRVTAWAIYNCDSGVDFLNGLSEEQTSIVFPWIDPTYWKKRFQDFPAEVLWCRDTLTVAGF